MAFRADLRVVLRIYFRMDRRTGSRADIMNIIEAIENILKGNVWIVSSEVVRKRFVADFCSFVCLSVCLSRRKAHTFVLSCCTRFN